jgi:UbiD family decarboxylase
MHDLKSFSELIEGKEEHLVKVRKEVDPKFEACAVVQKLASLNRHPAVYYEKIKGSRFPAIRNLFVSSERVALSFGTTGQELNQVLRERELKPVEPQMVKEDLPKKWF